MRPSDIPQSALDAAVNAFDDDAVGAVVFISAQAETLCLSRIQVFEEFARRLRAVMAYQEEK